MICNLQKYATSSWLPVDFRSKCHIIIQDIFCFNKFKTSFPPHKIYYRLWIQWNCFRHVKGFFEKNMEKISLLCFESCCDVFGNEGTKGGSSEDPTLFVYLDALLIWVIITIELLCLCFDKNRFMGSMKEHPENSDFSLFGPKVWIQCTGRNFFLSWKWK